MSGGPTTTALVLAAAAAGSAGSLAGGYKTAEALAEQVAEVRASTERYRRQPVLAQPGTGRPRRRTPRTASCCSRWPPSYGVDLPATPVEDDDGWRDKVDVLVEAAPPVVSFTFGLPEPTAAAELRSAGCTLVQTVTSADEARQSVEAGMDALIVQSPDAGGHWGTFTPARPPERLRLPELVRAVRAATDLPIMAVGGIGTSADVAAALEAGAAGRRGRHPPAARDRGRHQPGTPGRVRPRTAATRSRPARSPVARRAGCPTPSWRRTTVADRWATRPCTTSPARSARPRPPQANPEHVNLWAGTGHRSIEARPAARS